MNTGGVDACVAAFCGPRVPVTGEVIQRLVLCGTEVPALVHIAARGGAAAREAHR